MKIFLDPSQFFDLSEPARQRFIAWMKRYNYARLSCPTVYLGGGQLVVLPSFGVMSAFLERKGIDWFWLVFEEEKKSGLEYTDLLWSYCKAVLEDNLPTSEQEPEEELDASSSLSLDFLIYEARQAGYTVDQIVEALNSTHTQVLRRYSKSLREEDEELFGFGKTRWQVEKDPLEALRDWRHQQH